MCVKWLATVRSPRKSAAATSRFVRPRQLRERVLDFATCGGEQAAAAGHMSEHPHAADALSVLLPGVERPSRLVQPTQLEQELDMIGAPPADTRLLPAELSGPQI